MKYKSKLLFYTLLLITFLLICIFIKFAYGSYTTHNLNNYLNNRYYSDYYAGEFMPALKSLDEYEDIDFTYHRTNDRESTANAYTLSVQYTQDNYENKKAEVYTDVSLIPNNKIDFNGLNVWRCYDDTFYYPTNFGMIAFDDEKYTVIYLYFLDESNSNDDINWILSEYFL